MKIILKVFLIVSIFPISIFCQRIISTEIKENNKLFRISVIDTVYNIGDKIKVYIEIENKSGEPFFVQDYISFYNTNNIIQPGIDHEKKKLFLTYSTLEFYPGYEFIKFRLIKKNELVRQYIYIDTGLLPKSKKVEEYNITIMFGYIKYSKKLLYLTKSNNIYTYVDDANDLSEIIKGYTQFDVRNLPILIK